MFVRKLYGPHLRLIGQLHDMAASTLAVRNEQYCLTLGVQFNWWPSKVPIRDATQFLNPASLMSDN